MALKQITFRVEPDEADRLEGLWRRAGFRSLQEAGPHAFHVAFSEEPDPEGVPLKYRPYLKRLAEVLCSGDSAAIDAVTKNIDFFHDRMRPDAGGQRSR